MLEIRFSVKIFMREPYFSQLFSGEPRGTLFFRIQGNLEELLYVRIFTGDHFSSS
jgi:hypothetical protein